jgi:hypothetical protein
MSAEAAIEVHELDSNHKAMAERYLDQIALDYPEIDPQEIVARAIAVAQANLPTAKEAARNIAEMRKGAVYCYLAFYGLRGQCQFLKVGMTAHPEQRLYGIATGNPLDCLWVYISRLPTRGQAYRVEQSILRHLSDHKRRGEWIEVACDAEGAAGIAREMAGLAAGIYPEAGAFSILSYRDGREAA